MAEINDLLPIDDNNVDRWPEGMPPSDVNNAGRADEGIMSRWHRDTNGSLTSTGTSTAYQLTTNQNLTAYYDGLEITFQAHLNSGANPTLQLGALGAASIVSGDDLELAADDIVGGSKVNVIYNGSKWVIMNIPRAGNIAFLDAKNVFTGNIEIQNGALNTGIATLRMEGTNNTAGQKVSQILLSGLDEGSNPAGYGYLYSKILSPAAGSEDGEVIIGARSNNTEEDALHIGHNGVFTPNATGGGQGADTINAKVVLADGVEYQKGWTYGSTVNVNSGTSVTITTSIPSGVNEINIFPRDIEQGSNNNRLVIQIGAGSVETTGYQSVGQDFSNSAQASSNYTNGFALTHDVQYDAGVFYSGTIFLNRITGNKWHLSSGGHANSNLMFEGYGYKDLSGALDRLVITTENAGTFQGSGTVDFRYR